MKKNHQGSSSEISSAVTSLYQSMHNVPHHRYRSWEHCYAFFQSSPKDIDSACLNLAFYLASWGMYRGSSFLLYRDYKVHEQVVREVLSPSYQCLKGASIYQYIDDNADQRLEALFELIKKLKNHYRPYGKVDGKHAIASDTLITKILLGTLGCVPAYDRYFIRGLRSKDLPFSYLNKSNFKRLVAYCYENKNTFEECSRNIAKYGMHYPDWKLVDMYFWSIGEKLENKGKR